MIQVELYRRGKLFGYFTVPDLEFVQQYNRNNAKYGARMLLSSWPR